MTCILHGFWGACCGPDCERLTLAWEADRVEQDGSAA